MAYRFVNSADEHTAIAVKDGANGLRAAYKVLVRKFCTDVAEAISRAAAMAREGATRRRKIRCWPMGRSNHMTEYLVKAEVEELWDAFRAECLAAVNCLGDDLSIEQVERARVDAGERGPKSRWMKSAKASGSSYSQLTGAFCHASMNWTDLKCRNTDGLGHAGSVSGRHVLCDSRCAPGHASSRLLTANRWEKFGPDIEVHKSAFVMVDNSPLS